MRKGFSGGLVIIGIGVVAILLTIYLLSQKTAFFNHASELTSTQSTTSSGWGNAIKIDQAANVQSYSYLQIPAFNTPSFQTTHSLTFEVNINPSVNSYTGPQMVFCKTLWGFTDNAYSTNNVPLCLRLDYFTGTTATPEWQLSTEKQNLTVDGTPIPLNAWTHLALTYDWTTGTIKTYVNGKTDKAPAALGQTLLNDSGGHGYIGILSNNASSSYSAPFLGTLDELRISNSVRYTSSFSPPSVPFTPDVNTVALYHFDTSSCNASGQCSTPDSTPNHFDALLHYNYTNNSINLIPSTVPFTPPIALQNDSFDSYNSTTFLPNSWIASNLDLNDKVTTVSNRSGNVFRFASSTSPSFRALSQTIPVSGKAGDQIHFVYWTNSAVTNFTKGWAFASVQTIGGSGPAYTQNNFFSLAPGWTQHELQLNTGADYSSVKVSLVAKTVPADIFFDSSSLKIFPK